ncbi:MAG: hypothetical protein ACHQ50_06360 [Fimbriimonadales bacterium]
MEPAIDAANARIESLTKQLDLFPSLPDKPMRLRFGRPTSGTSFLPEDQVVSVSGSTSIQELQKALAEHGQCLPLPPSKEVHFLRALQGSVAKTIDFNLPHALEAQCGSWRDWTLGMTVVLADGTIAKSGSHAVKNVAGYDVHKLMVGQRGTLGIIAEVVLRTFPISACPTPDVEIRYEWKGWRESAHLMGLPLWVQRTKPSDFLVAVRNTGDQLLEADWASSTLCASVPAEQELPRYPGDWVMRSGCGEKNLQFTDPTQIRLMKRAKEIFDPTHKLNPGEMGIF